MLASGTTIGRYRVEVPLGRGGIAQVFRVRHVQLGTLHALKVLLVAVPEVVQRLLAEGRVQASLRHPNLVRVTDVVRVGAAPALVMDLVDGPTVEEHLGVHGRLGATEVRTLFHGIVSGVAAAHAAGMVHRDLKPANVLLASCKTGLVPMVTDFGLVRALGQERVTQTGAAIGTPAYMAPEQWWEPSLVDARADLWSLGCVLYELACGRRAFDQEDPFDLLDAVREGDYRPPSDWVDDLEPWIAPTIAGLLTVEVGQRTPSAKWVLRSIPGMQAAEAAPEPTLRSSLFGLFGRLARTT